MQISTLAICDSDEEYAQRLMEYICNKQGTFFKVIVFTDKETLMQYLLNNDVEILLISDSDMGDDILAQNIQKIFLLSSGNILMGNKGISSIFKYQSGENILREIFDYYAGEHKEGTMPMHRKSVRIIGVYSPVGRTGKTTFALTLGQILAEEKSVIYLNLKEFSTFEKLLGTNSGGDLADLMYYFRQNPETLPIKLQAVVGRMHGLDYVPPLTFSEDLRNIETREWIELVGKIADVGVYDCIILDLSSMIGNIFAMLDICDVIYMPINDDRISLMKVNLLEECILRNEKNYILDRLVKIKLPKTGNIAWDEDYFEKQLWGEFGDFIRKLLKEECINPK